MPCADSFVLLVADAASISIPGDFPLILEPGSGYIIGFLYRSGTPPAHAFDIEVAATLGNGLPSNAVPTGTFDPPAPEGQGNVLRSGTLSGTLPLVRDIHYAVRVWIRQV